MTLAGSLRFLSGPTLCCNCCVKDKEKGVEHFKVESFHLAVLNEFVYTYRVKMSGGQENMARSNRVGDIVT